MFDTAPTDLHTRADRDGQAYIAYYDPESTYGFAWSGGKIEVCLGGMGEPVVECFDVPGVLLSLRDPLSVLDGFRDYCRALIHHLAIVAEERG